MAQEARTLEVVDEPTSALVAQQNAGIVSASPEAAAQAFKQYQAIQAQLDRAMPDCIMQIQGKKFRKKSYWRAIGTAFNVQTELRSEQRVEIDGDWGYLVTYRATAPNGRYMDGDGTCMASEKRPPMNTLHNVRAHAHTRAKNRAISDLVGFGEVSAEEVRDLREENAPAQPVRQPPRQTPIPRGGSVVSEKQRKLIWARTMTKADNLGVSGQDAEAKLREVVSMLGGVESSKDLPASCMDAVLAAIEGWTLADFGDGAPPDDVAF